MIPALHLPVGTPTFGRQGATHQGLQRPARSQRYLSRAASGSIQPFHLAIPVNNIAEARDFYGRIMGCPEGRSAKTWVDYNLFGHQIVCHHVAGYNASSAANAVDGDAVPVPHFGLAMDADSFHALAERVRKAGIRFEIEPHLRFKGAPGEQYTMFFKDPSGNALEFKSMTNPDNLFSKYVVD
ncbi:hypothetical protein WJX74_000476 [Apatococcus lobatus]|uniref:VOC domain-containing protein n=1 Tax=Apatococcus lobatus TaxID=904363 RepID=A0AAW1RS13_9CHLO